MKNIFTLCIGLMTALSSWAQSFEFQYQGESLADGETVIIKPEEDSFGDLSCETNNSMNPTNGLMLKLLNGTTATGSAILEITHNTLDAEMLQWCMGGACTNLTNQTSLTKQFTVTDRTQVQFDAIAIHSEGYLLATLKATIGLESHKVNIMFLNGDYTGIGKINAQCSMVNGQSVYDLLGRQVQRTSSGMYIITDGKHIRKVAIK
jgi:hypothetical protein